LGSRVAQLAHCESSLRPLAKRKGKIIKSTLEARPPIQHRIRKDRVQAPKVADYFSHSQTRAWRSRNQLTAAAADPRRGKVVAGTDSDAAAGTRCHHQRRRPHLYHYLSIPHPWFCACAMRWEAYMWRGLATSLYFLVTALVGRKSLKGALAGGSIALAAAPYGRPSR